MKKVWLATFETDIWGTQVTYWYATRNEVPKHAIYVQSSWEIPSWVM